MRFARIGMIAAGLGAAAGVLQLTLGTHPIVGDKADPVTLGVVTLALAAVVGGCAWSSSRLGAVGRLWCGLGLVAAALVGTTTAGVAWFPAASLGLVAGVRLLRPASLGGRLPALLADQALSLLLLPPVLVLVLFSVVVGGPIGVLGAVGAAGASVGIGLRRRCPRAARLLVASVLPFAVATWWSGVTPLTAALLLGLGGQWFRRASMSSSLVMSERPSMSSSAARSRSSSTVRSS